MRVGIVGGYGKMGRWFCKNLPYDVAIFGRDFEKTKIFSKELGVKSFRKLDELLDFSDLIVVSVPLIENKRVLEEVRERIPSKKMIFDIASLKIESVKILADYPESVKVSSVHPMFGPKAKDFEGKKVIVVPVDGREEESEFFFHFFKNLKARIFLSDAKTHDKMMALTLSLPHFFGYLFSHIISNHDIFQARKFEGPSFNYLSNFSKAILAEDRGFYFELMKNPEFGILLEDVFEKTQELIDIVKTNDFSRFEDLLKATRNIFKDEDFSKAYDFLYKLID
ncbi:MAG: prephenate dehydrogenase/arogenate dehydrogenase family protein [Candidatus Methanofastidiosia archaeon]